MKLFSVLLPATLAILATQPALAQDQPRLDEAAAHAIIDGCVAHAREQGQSFGIAVVDDGGHLVAALRMDGNSHGIQAFALRKAQAAAAWRAPTSRLAEGIERTPGFAHAPFVIGVGGGVPIYDASGQYVIGAVGASGESQAADAACGVAGIVAAGLRSSRADQ